MNFEEFLKPTQDELNLDNQNETAAEEPQLDAEFEAVVKAFTAPEEEEEIPQPEVELEVQKAVVESLAEDSAKQQEIINELRKQVNEQQSEIASLKLTIHAKERIIAEQNVALGKVGEVLAKNSESPVSTKITLLEREGELPDRFEGESRDHVLEALKEARERAEADGLLRHAQILESVLLANEPNGNLEKKREELKKLFADNANLVSGPVIERLKELGIPHKNGEEYLLPSEILKRTY